MLIQAIFPKIFFPPFFHKFYHLPFLLFFLSIVYNNFSLAKSGVFMHFALKNSSRNDSFCKNRSSIGFLSYFIIYFFFLSSFLLCFDSRFKWFRLTSGCIIGRIERMEATNTEGFWYTPLDQFPQQTDSNSEAAIFRCRKRVYCGALTVMTRARNCWKVRVRRLARSRGESITAE